VKIQFDFLIPTKSMIKKFLFNEMLIIHIWVNLRNLLKDLSVSLTFLFFISMVLWSSLVVPIIQNVLTYVVLFPTSRDLSPIEDASVVIPTCFLRVLHVLPVVACILHLYGSHSGVIKFYFLLPTQCLSNLMNRCLFIRFFYNS
jgi:hypothetical protein